MGRRSGPGLNAASITGTMLTTARHRPETVKPLSVNSTVMAKLPKEFETSSALYIRRGLPLGQGGVGTVFEVADSESNLFALKLFTSDSVSTEVVKRFENEMRFLLLNKHPHLVNVIDTGFVKHETRKLPFYVMPRFSGTLRKLISQGFQSENILPYFLQILEGLEVLHHKKCWHRDLKPENILFNDEADHLLLADLGAAHFAEEELHTLIETKATSRMANFRYSAPEQRVPGRLVDWRADIYALGLILNEMFTGEVIQGQGHPTIAAVDSDYAELDEMVYSMIQHEAENRPASVEQIKDELKERGYLTATDEVMPAEHDSAFSDPARDKKIPSIRSKRAATALATGNGQSLAFLQNYFEKVVEHLPQFEFKAGGGQLDTLMVMAKVEEITPLRDEVIDVIVNIAKYRTDTDSYQLLHDFFERLIPFFVRRQAANSNSSWASDHYKLFAGELFLYSVAATVKWRRFLQLNLLTERDYFVRPDEYYAGDAVMVPFYKFATYSEAMHWFNKQHGQTQYLSPQGHLLKERSNRSDVDFEDLKQADFLLYLLFNLDKKTDSPRTSSALQWYPRLAPYFAERYAPFEVFARSQSHSFYENFRTCMRNTQKDDLAELLQWLTDNRQDVFNDGTVRLNLKLLTNIERLDTVP